MYRPVKNFSFEMFEFEKKNRGFVINSNFISELASFMGFVCAVGVERVYMSIRGKVGNGMLASQLLISFPILLFFH